MILIYLIVILLAGAFLAILFGRNNNVWPRIISLIALSADLIIISLFSMRAMPSDAEWMINIKIEWIPAFGINLHLALDGLSLVMLFLTFFLGIIAVVISWKEIDSKVGFFHFNLLLILAGITGVFLSLDLFLFYFFWELMLVPMYFLIGIWGHENRTAASNKFFLYTQASGLLMFIAIISLFFIHGNSTGIYTFDYLQLLGTVMPASTEMLIMLGFLAAFLVKLPVVPLHNWLPDAHTEAPTAGSLILAALLLKTGAYGLLRFIIPLFPSVSLTFAPIGMLLGVVGILYGAKLAFAQTDLKRLVAYTSVSHMGFVILGVFSFNEIAYQGVVIQMIAHGISTGALFILVGQLYERIHTRDINKMGGLWEKAPVMGAIGLIFSMASLGLPGLGNFIAELLILIGAFKANVLMSCLASLGLIAATIYSLRIVQKVFLGNKNTDWKMNDLNLREKVVSALLVTAIVWLGLFPKPVLETARPAIIRTLHNKNEIISQETNTLLLTTSVALCGNSVALCVTKKELSQSYTENQREAQSIRYIDMTEKDFLCLTPFMIIAIAPIVIMIVVSIVRNYNVVYGFSILSLLSALGSIFIILPEVPHTVEPLFIIDAYSLFFLGIIILSALLVTFLSYEYILQLEGVREEYYIVLFTSTLGAALLAVANHFVLFFLGIETLSISLYILIAFQRSKSNSIEAGIKYLILASMASAFLLFGMALIYTAFGTMQFTAIVTAIGTGNQLSSLVISGFGMMLVGIGFKLALVPFHMWTPDVYQGAPAPVSAYIATVSKGAVMAVLIRLFFDLRGFDNQYLFITVSGMALLSMFIGNILAIKQKNIKRLLGYSSIANMGYLIIILLTGSNRGIQASIFYLMSYFVTTIGAFGVITLLSTKEYEAEKIEDFRGLFWKRPWIAIVFTLSLLSLAGIPVTAGFIAKFYVIMEGLKAGLLVLIFSLIINSVIGLYYYLRIITTLFSTTGENKLPELSLTGNITLAVVALTIVVLGVYPGWLIDMIARFVSL